MNYDFDVSLNSCPQAASVDAFSLPAIYFSCNRCSCGRHLVLKGKLFGTRVESRNRHAAVL